MKDDEWLMATRWGLRGIVGGGGASILRIESLECGNLFGKDEVCYDV
jgi:hypothetical protein